MPFGYDRQPRVYLNNTATLNAYLSASDDAETLVPAADITGVTFTVLKPNDAPGVPIIALDPGVVVADGHGQYLVPALINDVQGSYRAFATFDYTEGGNAQTRSVPVFYDVANLLENSGAVPSAPALDLAWTRFEDMFDSTDGGPWLRDMTLAHFDKDKLRAFVPFVLLDVNTQMPQTNYDEASFPYTSNDGTALMAHGLFLYGVRHLMTSYVEQPTPMNQQVAYQSREEYHRRWGEIYAIELPRWEKMLAMSKARGFDLSSSAMIVGTKAGRLLPGYQRTRNIGRGWM
jgi:hypothetical protein